MVANVEMTDRAEQDESAQAGDAAHAAGERRLSWLMRLTPARLTSRIVLLNIAGLIILVSGILYSTNSVRASSTPACRAFSPKARSSRRHLHPRHRWIPTPSFLIPIA